MQKYLLKVRKSGQIDYSFSSTTPNGPVLAPKPFSDFQKIKKVPFTLKIGKVQIIYFKSQKEWSNIFFL